MNHVILSDFLTREQIEELRRFYSKIAFTFSNYKRVAHYDLYIIERIITWGVNNNWDIEFLTRRRVTSAMYYLPIMFYRSRSIENLQWHDSLYGAMAEAAYIIATSAGGFNAHHHRRPNSQQPAVEETLPW